MFTIDKPGTERVILLDEGPTEMDRHWIKTPDDPQRQATIIACMFQQGADKCLACEVQDGYGMQAIVSAVERVGMVNIARYVADGNGTPIRPTVLMKQQWQLSRKVLGALHTRVPEINGDIRTRDVIVSRSNPQYRVYDVNISEQCVAGTTEQGKAMYQQCRTNLKTSDEMDKRLARVVDETEMARLIEASGVVLPPDYVSPFQLDSVEENPTGGDISLTDLVSAAQEEAIDMPETSQAEPEQPADTLGKDISLEDLLG